jgi:type I restriction-modification system DNA methylase subunit
VCRISSVHLLKDIAKIKDTYHNWRKGENYQNEKGFCKSATLQEIQKHSHVLTPGRYVGIPDEEVMRQYTLPNHLPPNFYESLLRPKCWN